LRRFFRRPDEPQDSSMTPPAYRFHSSLRPVDHGKRFLVEVEPQHGRTECAFEFPDFCVRRAATRREQANTACLVKEMYSRRGYSTAGIVSLPRRDNTITLDAQSGDDVVATLTVRLDSKDSGLYADSLYRSEIDAVRDTGRSVCEVCKLAVDPRYGSKELLASLFQLGYLYAHVIHRASDVFIEVNPRHAGFYKRMLGFEEAGGLRICPRVNAPAVLLHVELAYMRRQIELHGGHGHLTNEKSLYPYFSSCRAEDSIHRAMRARARRHH
jgi:hypothetical protein